MKHQVEARDTWRVVKVESEVSRGVFGYLTGRRGTGRDFGCEWEAPKPKVMRGTALQVFQRTRQEEDSDACTIHTHTHVPTSKVRFTPHSPNCLKEPFKKK